ncbi:sel1 repeat family protein [Pelomyxa schiedti]|nr:sel1 repeat family protein [Pelomyxa schiedti]
MNCGGTQSLMSSFKPEPRANNNNEEEGEEGGIGAGLGLVTSLGLGDYDGAYHACLHLLLLASPPHPCASCSSPPASGDDQRFDLNGLLASTIDPINTYVDESTGDGEFRCECTCGGGVGGGKWRALALLVLRSVYRGKPSLFKEYRPHLVYPPDGLRIAVKNCSTESRLFATEVLDTACLNKPRLDVDTAGMTQEEKRKYEEAKAMWCAGTYLRSYCLFHGIGTPEDRSGALLLDLECEPYGFGPSLFAIGWYYEWQGGVEKDFAKAFQYYLSAAEKGEANSQVSLGLMYKEGRGMKTNEEEAVRWLQKSCEQDNSYGYSNLALCFKFGKGVKKDEETATRLLKLAVEPVVTAKIGASAISDTLAQRELAKALLTGQGTTSHLPNPTLAVKFFKLAAEKGDLAAQECLGLMYFEGAGEEVPQQYPLAVKYFRQAANAGSHIAQNSLGLCYLRGCGVTLDMREAFRLYTLSATRGNHRARFNLAACYAMKEGATTTRDVREALRWFRLSAEQGHPTSIVVMKQVKTGKDILTALRASISS